MMSRAVLMIESSLARLVVVLTDGEGDVMASRISLAALDVG
jgi:hypothetical protein